MTQHFEERTFRGSLDIEEGAEIVAAYNLGGARRAVLVRLPDSYECGTELDSGGTCSREVDGPDERCWDHE